MNNDLISREALKKHITDIFEREVEIDEKWARGLKYSLKIIDNAPTVAVNCKNCDGYEAGYSAGVRDTERLQGEWIPVSERLPNTLGVYNVTRKLNEGETIYFISGISYFDGQNTWHADTGINHGRQYLTDIIAWQPLPEPYKKEGKEE